MVTFNRWVATAFDWLCAWSGQLRHSQLSLEEGHLYARDRGAVYGSDHTIKAMMAFGQRPSTVDEIRGAFTLASRKYELPLTYAMLSRARTAFAHGEMRQSVIDACTAAEVALAVPVRRWMEDASGPSEAVEKVLGRSGIVELFRLYVAMGGQLTIHEKRLMNQLAEPRNRATHAGVAPERNEAQRALEIASAIISGVLPLLKSTDTTRRQPRVRP
jgi:hypothetical protein